MAVKHITELIFEAGFSQHSYDFRPKRSPAKPLSHYAKKYRIRDEAMAHTYLSCHYTLVEIGMEFDVSYATVSRAVKGYEAGVKCKA